MNVVEDEIADDDVFMLGPAAVDPVQFAALIQARVERLRDQQQIRRNQQIFSMSRYRYTDEQKDNLIQIVNEHRVILFTGAVARRRQGWTRCHEEAVRLNIFRREPEDRRPRHYWQYFRSLWNLWKTRATKKRRRLQRTGHENRLTTRDVLICEIDDYIMQVNPGHPPRGERVPELLEHNNPEEEMEEEELEGGGVLTEEFQQELFAIGGADDADLEDQVLPVIPQPQV